MVTSDIASRCEHGPGPYALNPVSDCTLSSMQLAVLFISTVYTEALQQALGIAATVLTSSAEVVSGSDRIALLYMIQKL